MADDDVPQPIKTSHKLRRQARRRDDRQENRNQSKQDLVHNVHEFNSRNEHATGDLDNV